MVCLNQGGRRGTDLVENVLVVGVGGGAEGFYAVGGWRARFGEFGKGLRLVSDLG